MKFLTIKPSLLVVCLLSLFCNLTYADEKPEGDPIFSIRATDEWWDNNSLPSVQMISKKATEGSRWITSIFVYPDQRKGLCCGINNSLNVTYFASITSMSPLQSSISSVCATLQIDYPDKVVSISMKSCPDDRFEDSNTTVIKKTEFIKGSNFLIFDLPDPLENQYYQFEIGFRSTSASNWIKCEQLDFYNSVNKISVPVIEKIPDSPGKFALTSHKGELHVLASIYDYGYNFIEDVYFPGQSSKLKVATDTEDSNWRNKLADEGESFIMTAPENTNHYMKIRAKSVLSDGSQSEELVTWINNNGITTGLDEINNSDINSQVEWYNLQGMKIENPTNGIFIKVSDGKSVKVKL